MGRADTHHDGAHVNAAGDTASLPAARCVKLAAGAAAGLAALAVPAAANASIVYTPVTQLVNAQNTYDYPRPHP